MWIFILFAVLVCAGAFYSCVLKIEICVSFVLGFLEKLIVIYIFGILNLLKFGVYFTLFLTLLQLVYASYYLIKDKSVIKEYILKPALIYYALVFVASAILFRNSFLVAWDEFTHWGLYPKNVFLHDCLVGERLTSTNNGYPPIIALFQYFNLSLNGSYSEPILYQSLFIFTTISLSPCLKFISLKKPIHAVLLVIVMGLSPTILFNNYFSIIYVDILLACLFSSMIIYLVFEEISIFKFFFISLIGCILILVKEFGLILVGIYYCILFLDLFFFRRKEYFEFIKNKVIRNKGKIFSLFVIFILPLLTKVSWMVFLKVQSTAANSQLGALSKEVPNFANTIVSNFCDALKGTGLGNGFTVFSPIIWLIIVIAILIFTSLFMKEKKRSKVLISLSTIVIVIFMVYTSALLFSYVFLFGEYEGVALASFDRYMKTMLLSIIQIVLICLLIMDYKGYYKNKVVLIFCGVLIMGTVSYSQIKVIISKSLFGYEDKLLNENIYQYVEDIKETVSKGDKIYYICQEDQGAAYWTLRYKLTPIKLQELNWAIGSSTDEKDLWTTKMNYEEWNKKLLKEEFDYVFIEKENDQFIQDFGMLFEKPSDISVRTLFQINEVDGKVVLKLIKNFQ